MNSYFQAKDSPATLTPNIWKDMGTIWCDQYFLPFLKPTKWKPYWLWWMGVERLDMGSIPSKQKAFYLSKTCLLRQQRSLFFKNGTSPVSFRLFMSFQTNITIFTTNICEKVPIHYMVLGFEPVTFTTWVSSHNHKTRGYHLFGQYCNTFETYQCNQCGLTS